MSAPVHRSEAWLIERVARDELRKVSAALMAADELANACDKALASGGSGYCRICRTLDLTGGPLTHSDGCALAKYRSATS